MALTGGLGVGGGAAISRRIGGARDKAGADNVAVHTFVIMLVLTVVLTGIGLSLVRDLFVFSGGRRNYSTRSCVRKGTFCRQFCVLLYKCRKLHTQE